MTISPTNPAPDLANQKALRKAFESDYFARHDSHLYCESEWRGWQAGVKYARAAKPAPAATQALLYEHEDGRHAVSFVDPAPFAAGNPTWHRVGPVEVHGAEPPQAETRKLLDIAYDMGKRGAVIDDLERELGLAAQAPTAGAVAWRPIETAPPRGRRRATVRLISHHQPEGTDHGNPTSRPPARQAQGPRPDASGCRRPVRLQQELHLGA